MNNNKTHTVEVSFHAESEKSFGVLVDKGNEVGSWARKEWFPKKLCVLEKIPAPKDWPIKTRYFLVAPEWLLIEKKVVFNVGTIYKIIRPIDDPMLIEIEV